MVNSNFTFVVDNEDGYSFDEATAMAIEAFESDELFLDIYNEETGEEFQLCPWCKELISVSELVEVDAEGMLCDKCISAIKSRGEEI